MQKVCSAKALLCLTLSAYLVLQQPSLSQKIYALKHFSRQTVLVSPPPSFCRVSFQQLEYFSNNKPHFSSAYDITSKQVLVPKRGKKKY